MKRCLLLIIGALAARAANQNAIEQATENILKQYDADNSGDWNPADFAKFFASLPEGKSVPPEQGFATFDTNGDGKIARAELAEQIARSAKAAADASDPTIKRAALESMFPESQREIEYTDADGEKRTMKREEMIERLMAQEDGGAGSGGADFPPGFANPRGIATEAGFERDEEGRMVRKQEGTVKLDELKDKNPSLHRHMQIAKFAHEKLMASGYAMGNLTELNNSPREPPPTLEEGDGTWTKMMLLTISQDKVGAQIDAKKKTFKAKYEVEVNFNPSIHKAPGLAVVNAWRVNKKTDDRIEELPLLEEEEDTFAGEVMSRISGDTARKIVMLSGVAICAAIVKLIRTFLMKALGLDDAVEKPKAPKQEEKTAAVDTDDAPSKKGSKTGGNPKKKKGQKGD